MSPKARFPKYPALILGFACASFGGCSQFAEIENPLRSVGLAQPKPASAERLLEIAEIYERMGNTENAKSLYTKVIAQPESPDQRSLAETRLALLEKTSEQPGAQPRGEEALQQMLAEAMRSSKTPTKPTPTDVQVASASQSQEKSSPPRKREQDVANNQTVCLPCQQNTLAGKEAHWARMKEKQSSLNSTQELFDSPTVAPIEPEFRTAEAENSPQELQPLAPGVDVAFLQPPIPPSQESEVVQVRAKETPQENTDSEQLPTISAHNPLDAIKPVVGWQPTNQERLEESTTVESPHWRAVKPDSPENTVSVAPPLPEIEKSPVEELEAAPVAELAHESEVDLQSLPVTSQEQSNEVKSVYFHTDKPDGWYAVQTKYATKPACLVPIEIPAPPVESSPDEDVTPAEQVDPIADSQAEEQPAPVSVVTQQATAEPTVPETMEYSAADPERDQRLIALISEAGNQAEISPAVEKILGYLVEHGNPIVSLVSAEALIKHGDVSEKSIATVQSHMANEDETIRMIAVHVVASLQPVLQDQAVELLIEKTQTDSLDVRRLAILLLGEFASHADRIRPHLENLKHKTTESSLREAADISLRSLNELVEYHTSLKTR